MNFTNPIKTAAVLASATVFAVCAPAAQDEAAADNSAEKPAAEQAAAGDGEAQLKTEDKYFYPLLRCKEALGIVEVRRPREGYRQDKETKKQMEVWLKVKEGRFYPLGSTFRVKGDGKTQPRAVFEFGDKSKLTVGDGAMFKTEEIDIGDHMRTLVPMAGRMNLSLPLQMKEGFFKVVTTNGYVTCENLAGDSSFEYVPAVDSAGKVTGDRFEVRCVTGSMKLIGQHYQCPRLVAANCLNIETSTDGFFSSLVGKSGDCKTVLDQGLMAERNFETGEMVEIKKTLDFVLSPECSIKILRAKSPIGGRTVVSMMTFNALGVMKNRIAFAEGRSNVNSGELVVSTKVAEDDKDKAAAKSKLDEETEAVEVKPAKKADTDEEEPKEEKKEEKKKDETDDDLL